MGSTPRVFRGLGFGLWERESYNALESVVSSVCGVLQVYRRRPT